MILNPWPLSGDRTGSRKHSRLLYAKREAWLSIGLWTITLTTPMKLPENATIDPKNRGASSITRARKIIHIDMDAFYASVEQRDNPELRGKLVAVGGARARGVVAAASYEARKFGVRSAMPSITAMRRCPALIFVKPRFDVYKEVSLQIRAIFAEYRIPPRTYCGRVVSVQAIRFSVDSQPTENHNQLKPLNLVFVPALRWRGLCWFSSAPSRNV